MIGSIFCNFLQKIYGFSGFFGFFVFFRFVSKQFVSVVSLLYRESFDVSIEPKQTEVQPKQFDRGIFCNFLQKILGFSDFWVYLGVFSVFFGLFRNVFFRIFVFFRKFRVVSVCFGLLRNNSVCFGCFDIGSKNRNKPK